VSDSQSVFGIRELDEALFPTLPMGWLALLTGTPGSGVQLLAKQFAHAGVGSAPVLFYTTYERTEDVRKVLDDYGWDADAIKVLNLADEYYDRVLVRGLEISRAREHGLKYEEIRHAETKTDRFVSFNLTNRMLSDLGAIDGPFRLVLDSLDFFLEVLTPDDVTTVARQIRHRCQTLGGQALLTLHGGENNPRVISLLEELSNLVLEIRVLPEETRFEHWILVRKVANHPDLARIVRAEVTREGWQIAERVESSVREAIGLPRR
jgi:KaiC/GvpD/RAD55 family RecA-like ATPase